jgi:hypothetical protein
MSYRVSTHAEQGDLIRRIFAIWAIVHYRAVFLLEKVLKFLGYSFRIGNYALISTKKGLG